MMNIYKTQLQLLDNNTEYAQLLNSYNQVFLLTRDTIWKSDKNTRKQNAQESQKANPLPVGNHKTVLQETYKAA